METAKENFERVESQVKVVMKGVWERKRRERLVKEWKEEEGKD
jgi:hypothetical protein